MTDIRDWLESLGLGRYAPAFEDNDIGWDVLTDLDHEVLKDIGVSTAGDRLRILKAIDKLHSETPEETGAEAAPARPASRPAVVSEAERRQLTVVFCDLVGSTALAERMDLEEYRDVLAAYQTVSGKAIENYDGYIARYMGDGLLVYFGYPQAHEDDAERAVRAALAIAESVASLKLHDGLELKVRIGIATGQVVVGDIIGEGASEERAVLGDVPSLAARLQSLAAPGSVLISAATRKLTGKLFTCEDAGRHRLKGFAEGVQAWRVVSEATTESRFQATRHPEGTVLVGREIELLLLLDAWERAEAAEGRVVLLSGEPGIGKSRLIHAFRQRIESKQHAVLQFQCSPHHANSPFYPFIEHIQRTAKISPNDHPDTKLDKLEAWLVNGRGAVNEAVPFIAELLSIPTAGRYRSPELSPQQQKQRTIEVLAGIFSSPAVRSPLLLLFEDVHWADPTTLELMSVIIDDVAGTGRLMIVTHRPEFVPPWRGRGHVTAHSLGRLGRRQVTEVIESMTGGKSLPEAMLREIAAKTDGVPLFIEELTKAVLEAGLVQDTGQQFTLRGPRPLLSVPSTLRDSLIARLDRLGEVKDVAQMAAVIGREFSYALLAELCSLDDSTLNDALAQLERAELIFRRGTVPDSGYHFKHALVQDAAYDSLLKRDRERLHARLSAVLESRFPDVVSQMPELLAHHHAAAGQFSEALTYWTRAAELALARSAYQERLAHLDAALRILRALPDPEQRRAWELELHSARGGALMATKGYRATETGEAFARAREVAESAGNSRQTFAALRGLHGFHYSRAELDAALEAAEACLEIAEQSGDRQHLALAHRLVGQTHFIRGKLDLARLHLEQAMALASTSDATEVAELTGGGHRLMAPVFLAQVRWLQGFPDQALDLAEGALEEAKRQYGAFSVTTNMFFLCWILGLRREYQALKEQAEQIRRLAGEHEIYEWVDEGGLLADWPRLMLGEAEDAVGLARQRLEAVRKLGGIMTGYKLALLAAALVLDDAGEALEVINEALTLTEGGERWSEPELLRIKGKVLLGSDEPAAEACFQGSLRMAREQGARSWELRTATSLAKLWCAQGKFDDARDLLSPIYHGFTEAFDTADLQDAKLLLDGLATNPGGQIPVSIQPS